MYFAKVLAALAASTIVAAQVALTNSDYSGITIGVPLEISWAGNTGTVKLLLKNGPADNQALVGTIAGKLDWTLIDRNDQTLTNAQRDSPATPSSGLHRGQLAPTTSRSRTLRQAAPSTTLHSFRSLLAVFLQSQPPPPRLPTQESFQRPPRSQS